MGIPGGAGRRTLAAVDPTEYRCYIKEGYPPIMQQRVQIFHRRPKRSSSAIQLPITATLYAEYLTLLPLSYTICQQM